MVKLVKYVQRTQNKDYVTQLREIKDDQKNQLYHVHRSED